MFVLIIYLVGALFLSTTLNATRATAATYQTPYYLVTSAVVFPAMLIVLPVYFEVLSANQSTGSNFAYLLYPLGFLVILLELYLISCVMSWGWNKLMR